MEKCNIKRLRLFITAFVKIILVFIGKCLFLLGICLVCVESAIFWYINIFHYPFCKNYIGFYWKVFAFVGNLPCLCRKPLFFGILIFFITDYEKVIKNILYAICKMLLVELY